MQLAHQTGAYVRLFAVLAGDLCLKMRGEDFGGDVGAAVHRRVPLLLFDRRGDVEAPRRWN